MKIKFFCPQWGSKDLDNIEFVEKVNAAGYDGIEMSLPLDKTEKELILKDIKENHPNNKCRTKHKPVKNQKGCCTDFNKEFIFKCYPNILK